MGQCVSAWADCSLTLTPAQIKAGVWYDDPKDPRARKTVTQYHEVVGFMTHPILSGFAVIIVIITAIGTCLPQVSCPSFACFPWAWLALSGIPIL